jgi:predicted amidohydrolase YtcJ
MKKIFTTIAGLLALALLATAWISRSPGAPRAAVFVAADIVTMSSALDSATAVFVEDGVISGIGSTDAMRKLAGTDTAVIDLGTATLLPGLIEVHTHPLAAALLGTTIDVSGFTHDSRSEVMQTLAEATEKFSLGAWLVAFGWDPLLIDDLEPPTLAELDALSPDRPLVVLTQMMHDAYANSAALAAAGIDENTPNPQGAEFVRDATGALTGTIREVGAISRLLSRMPEAPEGSVELLLSLQYAKYARAGYTTVGVLGPAANVDRPLHLMAGLAQDEHIPVRAVVYGLPEQIDAGGWQPGPLNDRFRVRGVKFWMDGSPFAGGAAWDEPYENNALTLERLHLTRDHMPELNYEQDAFEALFEKYHRRGFQVAVHVQGERAVRRVLDTVERVQRRVPREDARHRLEHNALITEAQLERALLLGVTPSFFIDHIYFYGHRLPELVGEERTQRYMPIGTALELGHRATLHSDNPATPISPFRVLRGALLRAPRGRSDSATPSALAPSERLTIQQALRAMTIDAAWQLGIENHIGSLEVGKAADFLALSSNPLNTPAPALTDIEVLGTWVGGQPVDTRPWRRANIVRGLTAVRQAIF